MNGYKVTIVVEGLPTGAEEPSEPQDYPPLGVTFGADPTPAQATLRELAARFQAAFKDKYGPEPSEPSYNSSEEDKIAYAASKGRRPTKNDNPNRILCVGPECDWCYEDVPAESEDLPFGVELTDEGERPVIQFIIVLGGPNETP